MKNEEWPQAAVRSSFLGIMLVQKAGGAGRTLTPAVAWT